MASGAFLVIILVGAVYSISSLASDLVGIALGQSSRLSPPGRGAADRARLRVRQRLPRHRQCGGDGDLHPFPAGLCRGRLVGDVQLPRRAAVRAARSPSASSRCCPVELILQVGSRAGFAMVFALLIAAIIWNLGTWYLGLPSSSSHTLIGSIIGVGLMNQLMASGNDAAPAASIGARRWASASRCCSRRSSAFLPRPCCCCMLQGRDPRFPPSIRRPKGRSRRPGGSAAC